MKYFMLCIAVLIVTACRDGTHPKELVGSWISDLQMDGGRMRVVDSLELHADGTGASHRRIYALTPSPRNEGVIDTLISDKGHSATNWEVVYNEDGRHLCLSDADGSDKECAPLKVRPETKFTWGEFSYRSEK